MQMLLFMFGPGLYLFFVMDQLILVKTMNPQFYPCDSNTNSNASKFNVELFAWSSQSTEIAFMPSDY
ncbi:hypothetical protein AMELA_G00288280 [Ameiurus melas]|uniref:Uncharacterized protein n=1 Tax=Ameiurus melas TaxID=219545 RepID=A0A7J5ZJP1_AMEME|nr:hypothetical protein AMELA_G00288280 [Ameiurus melas]